MELEQIFKIIEKFDASESSYLELQLAEDYIKLKKPSDKTVVQMASTGAVNMIPAPVVNPVDDGAKSQLQNANADTDFEEKDYV